MRKGKAASDEHQRHLSRRLPRQQGEPSLEGVARAFHERVRVWDATLAEVVGQSVDDLKHLVRQAREWTADDFQPPHGFMQADPH